ncbi:7400_t:CDS:2 [Cetraspora pellucida]|uniref:7400_t:CDS:1 n=1 Tax=Cetraspora pellucida TaxID=1433469 RepID=A0A9N9F4M3_9GLOM|nr:7400_t:CDS:2 [Cetraspora pellucida]
MKKSCPKTLFDGLSCTGLSVLRKIKQSTLVQCRTNQNQHNNRVSKILQCKDGYFIGCSFWSYGDNWHRFTPISKSYDINLIRRLLDGESIDRLLIEDRCCTILPNTTQKKICPQLENMPCEVKFYRFMALNLLECPFVVLVCIGEHTHPLPLPYHVPEAIQARLKTLIKEFSNNLEHVTPRKLISGNLIKSYFGNDLLSEIHVSLNNLDHLRYLVAQVHNSIHPHGQDILDLVHAFSSNLDNIREYVQKVLIADKEHVDAILHEFSISDEAGASEDWCIAGETTNIAESAHANANREEIQMNKYNVPKTDHSSGPVTKATQSIKRLESKQLHSSKGQKRKKPESALLNKKLSPTSKTTITSNKELDELDIEIAKREKLRRLELIDYEFQYKKEILDIDKQTKLAELHAQ